MNIAISVWGNHISTVFDFCDRLLVAYVVSGSVKDRKIFYLPKNTAACKDAGLRGLEIDVLLCGAISRPLYNMIKTSGIEIIPFLRGTVDEVLDAYLSDSLLGGRFMLPGCHSPWWELKGQGIRHCFRSRGKGTIKKGL